MIEFCLLDLVIVIVAKIFCILFHLPFPYCAKKNLGGGGYFWEFLVLVYRPVLQILTDDSVSDQKMSFFTHVFDKGIESRARVPLWQGLKFLLVSFKLCKIVQGQKKLQSKRLCIHLSRYSSELLAFYSKSLLNKDFGKSLIVKLFEISSSNHHKRHENRETAYYHGLLMCKELLTILLF